MSDATSRPAPARQPADTDTRAAWGPSRAILGWVLSFFGAQLLLGIIFSIAVQAFGGPGQSLDDWYELASSQFMVVLVGEIITLFILWLFLSKYTKPQIIQGLGLRRPRLKDAGYVLLGAALYFGVYIAIMTVVAGLTPIDLEQQQDIGFDGARGLQNLAWVFAALVILPPIVEEIVFRGYLYGGLRRKNGIVGSAIITSVIFGYLHSTQAVEGGTLWVAAIDTFVMSMVLCYLREKSGSILPGIGVHAIKNCVAFIAIFILHQ